MTDDEFMARMANLRDRREDLLSIMIVFAVTCVLSILSADNVVEFHLVNLIILPLVFFFLRMARQEAALIDEEYAYLLKVYREGE